MDKFVEYTSHSREEILLILAPADSVKAEEFAVVDLEAADDPDDLDAADEPDAAAGDEPDDDEET